VNKGFKKVNESLEQVPSSKFYVNDLTPKEGRTNKAKKRVKSARPKDKKEKLKVKKGARKSDFLPGFLPHPYLRETKSAGKRIKKDSQDKREKKEKKVKSSNTSSKSKKNLFKAEKGKMSQNPSSIELNDILNKSGLSDINVKKQMLINKIKNNEIDPDKYMRFVEASSKINEPDEMASEISSKGFNKKFMPMTDFNYGSYGKLGGYPPPVINTLIVNGNNYINQASQMTNSQKGRVKKGIKEIVTTSSNKISSNSKHKVISSGPIKSK